MAKTKEAEAVVEKAPEPEIEDRISEHAISMFQHIGFDGRLPNKLVEIYNDFKRVKDRVQPGRLSPDGFATVVTLYQLQTRI